MIRGALFAGLAAISIAACTADARTSDDDVALAPRAAVEEIAPEVVAARIEAGEAIQLIDVRTPAEFAEGHIEGAINIPIDSFDPAALPAARGATRVLYCRSDRRSGIAAARLAQASGETAVHMDGGIMAWEDAKFPVERD